MHLKTLAVTAAFLAGSTLGVAAQSTSAPGSADISAATHCKDKVTGQARLKSAASTTAPSGSSSPSGSAASNTTGSGAAGSGSPSGSGSTSGTMSGSAAGSSAGSVAATLPDCP